MSLTVELPPGREPERRYAVEVVLGDFLGLDFTVAPGTSGSLIIRDANESSARELVVADVFFAGSDAAWLDPRSLPSEPLSRWAPPAELDPARGTDRLPVLFGKPNPAGSYLEQTPGRWILGLDVFGSVFFLLTRYEELVIPARDGHGRFAAGSSLLAREGLLDRALVNEYLDLFWVTIQMLWPRLRRRERAFRPFLTHDVDRPLCVVDESLARVAGSAVADLIRRHDANLALRRLGAFWSGSGSQLEKDPCNTFDWMMDQSEAAGLTSAFYFFGGQTNPRFDARYTLGDARIRSLLTRIGARGHEIGLHPSYGTLGDAPALAREYQSLRQTAEQLGIVQRTWGGRQHYLRWEVPGTWQAWEDAGLAYDSTLGFADHAGFRTGTCYEYPVFNLHTRQRLTLRERPLIVMDVSLLNRDYMGLDHEQAWHQATRLLETCRRHQGDFVLLWHNNNLASARDRALYLRLLGELAA